MSKEEKPLPPREKEIAVRNPLERFFMKVQFTDTCWLWVGSRSGSGYGQFFADSRLQPAHRWIYSTLVKPIPDELFACHRCNNKLCVNPGHIYPATQEKNMQDAMRDGLCGPNTRPNRPETCVRGHKFDLHWIEKGRPRRGCSECKRTQWQRSSARLRALEAKAQASRAGKEQQNG